MADGVKRTVQIGSVAFIDPAGRVRRADHGAEVAVHATDVARFDLINGTVAPVEAEDPAPRRRRTRKEPDGNPVRDGD